MKKPVVLVLGMLGLAVSPALHGQGLFIRGDCDQDSKVNITDTLYALNFLFSGQREPLCLDACDADDSETYRGGVPFGSGGGILILGAAFTVAPDSRVDGEVVVR